MSRKHSKPLTISEAVGAANNAHCPFLARPRYILTAA